MKAWYDAFTDGYVWDEQLDVPRFRKAFIRFSKVDTNVWPQPREILALLPDREKFVALPAKPSNTEKTQQMIDGLKELFRMPNSGV
jgi:hypothetical protein